MDTNLITVPAYRPRRRHSPEFKAQAIAACLQPGVSIAAIALANQLNEVPSVVRLPKGEFHATSFSFCCSLSQISMN